MTSGQTLLDQATSRILNDATSQADRVVGAPAPERLLVDGRSLAQIVAFAARYGALVNFYDLHDAASGDWAPFFASDTSVILATHAALDLSGIERDLKRQLAKAQHNPALLGRVLTVLARLITIHDRDPGEPGNAEDYLRHPGVLARNDAMTDPLRRLHGHLGNETLERALQRRGPAGDVRWNDHLFEILDDISITVIGALRQGHDQALIMLQASLYEEGHAPQAALWNTFAKLFSDARAEINGFPRRLVDYYYGEVLQQTAVDAVPDELYLTFTSAQATDQASVPRAAYFSAGTDEAGLAIQYTAQNTLEVTPAKVVNLSVHRVLNRQTAKNAAGQLVAAPPTVLTGEIALDPTTPDAIIPFAMFGNGEEEKGSIPLQKASLGFTISSPVLMLTGGNRQIDIGLVITPQPVATEASSPPGAPIFAGEDTALLNKAMLAAQLIKQTFDLHYTTAGGWIKVEGMMVEAQLARRPGDDNRLIIRFILPADAPPLVDIDTKPSADPPPGLMAPDSFSKPPASPTVIGSINPEAVGRSDTNTLASVALQSLGIGAVTIEVAVDGLTGAKFVTPTGSYDGSQNFAAFGMPPVVGAGLDIIAPELFVKPLDTLSVTIKWAGLPITSTGFKGYYQDYILNADGDVAAKPQFDNASFRASFSVVNPGPWKVDPTAKSQPLFATQPFVLPELAMLASPPPLPAPIPPPAATPRPLPPEPDAAAPLKPDVLLEVPVVAVKDVPPYYNPATSALRLELSDPPYAFGNILYTSNLMAASTALGQANVAGLPNGGANGKQAVGELSRLSRLNTDAPEKTYLATIAPAVDTTLSSMTGEALVSVNQAIAASGETTATQEQWLADLNNAMADVTQHAGSVWQRITLRGATPGRPAAVLANLVAWLNTHEAEFGAGATVPLRQARNTLDAAVAIAAAYAAATTQPVALARPNIAAAVQFALTALLPPAIPNPPWQPTAAGLGINYTASARHLTQPPSATPTDDLARPNALVMPAVPPRSAAAALPLPVLPVTGLVFRHIEPFNKTSAPVAAGLTTLLPTIDDNDALYIQLSGPASQISLLFMLTAGPDGWWSNPPPTDWSQYVDDEWQPVAMLADSTNNLSNSGIITLQLRPAPAGKRVRLRVRALKRTSNAPLVTAVIANALSASWVGPGGASGLGVPLPAKTISKAVTQLTNIGSIYQPAQSFGGRPPASGPAFQMWMAERLRHKGYGITDWDYARIVLENEPSLWQVKVVPAVDGFTGAVDAAGKVWVVAVPGAKTPNVVDTTAPLADLTTLSDVGRVIEQCVGPFVEVRVTNPPYLRLKVEIVCEFSADDTTDYWCIKLAKELTLWLSPWPDATVGPRPADYYTRRAIAEFVRNRSYVLGIVALKVGPDTDEVGLGWYYLTSVKADEHIVSAAPMVQRHSTYQPYPPPATPAPSS